MKNTEYPQAQFDAKKRLQKMHVGFLLHIMRKTSIPINSFYKIIKTNKCLFTYCFGFIALFTIGFGVMKYRQEPEIHMPTMTTFPLPEPIIFPSFTLQPRSDDFDNL